MWAPLITCTGCCPFITVTGLWWTGTSRNRRGNRSSVWLSCMLYRQGACTRTYGSFYLALVQYVLLFGSYSQVLTPRIMQALVSLHNLLAQWISGRIPWCCNRRWDYPPIGEALSDAGIDPIGGIYTNATLVRQIILPRGQYFTLQWKSRGRRDPRRSFSYSNRR